MAEVELRKRMRELLMGLGSGSSFTDVQDVFDTCVVTSLNLLELICHLEDSYGLVVEQRDIFDGHLRSVDRLVAFIASRAKWVV